MYVSALWDIINGHEITSTRFPARIPSAEETSENQGSAPGAKPKGCGCKPRADGRCCVSRACACRKSEDPSRELASEEDVSRLASVSLGSLALGHSSSPWQAFPRGRRSRQRLYCETLGRKVGRRYSSSLRVMRLQG